MDTIETIIARRTQETQDICILELAAVGTAALPAFSAGSHIDVLLPGGMSRQYSLCNDPSETHRYVIAVLREAQGRGGSLAMHELKEGATLRIGAPRNHFALVTGAQRSLLIAGGIGVTPILCMAQRLAVMGADFEMHYCSRSASRTAFLERIGNSGFAQRVHFHFDDGPQEQRADFAAWLAAPVPGTHLYVCGPKGMMDAVIARAQAAGWPAGQVHYEFFSGPAPAATGDSFSVKLASSGQCVEVPPGISVVQALAAHGVVVPTSCEQGVCGTCLVRVLDGVPDHRDLYLMPEERERNDSLLACCSRSLTPMLVLDL